MWALLEGDRVTLCCRRWWDLSVTGVQFYRGDEEVKKSFRGTELSLSPLQLDHSANTTAGAGKHLERAPPEPVAPPEEGEVLYTHVMSTKQAQRSPCITLPQEPQVTYAELPGPHSRPKEISDIYEVVL
ncbi:hypothetical protein HGM15179_021719 [Zosterops borbonicus]|uniref:Uncharacterized protein n=1 Tax=Zosterops borbonicus TaxID=364589 RepID=A0A8K1D7S0_9PASS|nr:hypothetical protein HGM15179_021719 [Zosterops borbonicus]